MSERFTIHLDDLILDLDLQAALRGKCIVANGCFDVLHPGHLSLLATLDTLAYQLRLRPIVALNSDVSVKRIKGPTRPIVPEEARASLLNNLKWPFTVVIFDEETPQRLMDMLEPNVVLKGGEYTPGSVIKWKDSLVITAEMVNGWSTSKIVGDR